MLDLEQLGSAAMEIIAYAGVAKSNYVEAARLARAYRFDEATALIDEGDAVMKNAHDAHLALLQKENRRCCASALVWTTEEPELWKK